MAAPLPFQQRKAADTQRESTRSETPRPPPIRRHQSSLCRLRASSGERCTTSFRSAVVPMNMIRSTLSNRLDQSGRLGRVHSPHARHRGSSWADVGRSAAASTSPLLVPTRRTQENSTSFQDQRVSDRWRKVWTEPRNRHPHWSPARRIAFGSPALHTRCTCTST
jgi:hypothetical protein